MSLDVVIAAALQHPVNGLPRLAASKSSHQPISRPTFSDHTPLRPQPYRRCIQPGDLEQADRRFGHAALAQT